MPDIERQLEKTINTSTRICLRRDTMENFNNSNTILLSGEIAIVVLDTGEFSGLLKIGDGSTPWNLLPLYCIMEQSDIREYQTMIDDRYSRIKYTIIVSYILGLVSLVTSVISLIQIL